MGMLWVGKIAHRCAQQRHIVLLFAGRKLKAITIFQNAFLFGVSVELTSL